MYYRMKSIRSCCFLLTSYKNIYYSNSADEMLGNLIRLWYTHHALKVRRYIMPRENITFKCTVCKEENYIGTRNKRKHTEKMEIKKYCPRCNKMTLHKEKK